MKYRSIILVIFTFTFVIGNSTAATVSIARGIGNPGISTLTADGTVLSTGGYYIAAGTFTNGLGITEEPVITNDFSSLLAAVAAFDVFGSASSPISGTTQGLIVGSINSLGAPDPAVFNLKQIYLLIGNGATQGTSTQFGIFKMTTPVFFPIDVTAASSTTVSTSFGTSISPLTNAGSVSGNSFQLIPEPSTFLLSSLGVLVLLRRRR